MVVVVVGGELMERSESDPSLLNRLHRTPFHDLFEQIIFLTPKWLKGERNFSQRVIKGKQTEPWPTMRLFL